MDSEIVDALSYVKLSKHRIKVIISIGNDTKTPSEIVHEEKIIFSDVSRALKGLSEENVVSCLNNKKKQGRLYQLTDIGKEVLTHIK